MVDCKARLTEEIFGRVKYMEDCMMIPGKKREMVGDFGIMDLEDRYHEKVKKDLVYEKSKMTMYIENLGRKINSNFGNFIKKHIVDYVYSPDGDGNILCYDCDNCSDCYKCVECVDCIDVFNSFRGTKNYSCYFNIECDGSAYLFFSRGCVDCGHDNEWDLASCSLFLKDCRNCKNCFNLIECVECEECIDCINCEDCEKSKRLVDCNYCEVCKDCKRCSEQRYLREAEDLNIDNKPFVEKYDWWLNKNND